MNGLQLMTDRFGKTYIASTNKLTNATPRKPQSERSDSKPSRGALPSARAVSKGSRLYEPKKYAKPLQTVQPKVSLNSKSEKFVLQKFNREFTDILLNILKQQQLPLKIYREPYDALMCDLGCIKSASSSTDA